jgi:protein SCO1
VQRSINRPTDTRSLAALWDNLCMTVRNRAAIFLLTCLLVVIGIGAIVYWHHGEPNPPANLATGTLIIPGRALKDFSLIDHHARALGRTQLRGHWSLLYFGYSHCPDVCPVTLATLAQFVKQLRQVPTAPEPSVIFISVDPERDTPAQLAAFVPYFDSAFLGASAEPAQLRPLLRDLGIALGKPNGAKGEYTIDHSGAVIVIAPDVSIRAVLTGPLTAAALQTDWPLIARTPP